MKRLLLTAILAVAVASTTTTLARQSDKTAKGKTTPVAVDDADVIEAQLMHYPLDTCIVGGGKLGSKGDPIDYVHEGRLVRFCCKGCIGPFKEDAKDYLARLDKEIIARQAKDYPLKTCVVSGQDLGSMGDAFEYVHENRLVLLCCGGCVKRFKRDPAKHMVGLDKAYADAQRDDYGVSTCVVGGGELGSMGDPYEIVAGTRLVRFCCKGCVPAFKKDPATYLAKLPK
jgi:hypothetical protein